MNTKKKVILVTDGDEAARQAIEVASQNVGAETLTISAGCPTLWSGSELVSLIKQSKHEPVVVMFDDKGAAGTGKGEEALAYVANHKDIEVLGALAVASNTYAPGIRVESSITKDGQFIPGPVNKFGKKMPRYIKNIHGDTLDILKYLNIPIIIGIGDVGKMDGADDYRTGAKITTRAFKEILDRSGFHGPGS
ncbi:sporulation protein VAE [Desulfofarcimen acetoxidans DSM 771]|uniref:Sporulation protein VAE n=1 Tax=Desulfofarcimen acetoxidans (strain ATCC 49208 / DSM 771 / KCTC 5769 / VKM B-1644 / 5575) TaxID=485916 RepID=C8VYY7_DESAS|nr:stage V sporulation protein AE [Desulfofarcimen acetoxidans]ACV62897.1 sporulation protein VAE [Desulfofarcimen acetoxidans DSM 771]